VKGEHIIVADTKLRIEAMSFPLDYQALAASQYAEGLKHLINSGSSLHLEKVPVSGSPASIATRQQDVDFFQNDFGIARLISYTTLITTVHVQQLA
jgi:hypothetical protein